MNKFGIFCVITFISFLHVQVPQVAGQELPAAELARVKESQLWLNDLKGKSPAAIQQKLGEPKAKEKWDFQGKELPLWRYTSENPKYTLLLYFHKEVVVTVSLQIQSD